VAVLSGQFGFAIDATTVKGHRDHAGASTSCPGENLHARLDDIRSVAAGGTVDVIPDTTETSGGAVVQGVVYDASITPSPSADGNVRLDAATISSSDGETRQARSSDAFWSFEVAPGTYEVTASADGYESGSRTVVLVAGDSIWASIGLVPVEVQEQPDSEEESEDEVVDEESSGPTTISQDADDESIPHDEAPSDANMPADPEGTLEDEGCSQTGSQHGLMVLLGLLWCLRLRARRGCLLF